MQSDLFASFQLTATEAGRVNGEIREQNGGTRSFLRSNLFLGLVMIVYGLLDPVIWREGGVQWSFVVLGGTFLLNAMVRWGRGSAKPGIETVVRFGEDGLSCERPRVFVARWKAVLGAFDDGEFITVNLRSTLKNPFGRPIVIPKRALPDEGAALWQLLRNSLIGTRMLVQSRYANPSARIRAITNTRS